MLGIWPSFAESFSGYNFGAWELIIDNCLLNYASTNSKNDF